MIEAAPDIKACCAAAYSTSAARFLLGDSFHPGGQALTAELIGALRVGPDATVVDVASGPGTSAIQMARATGCQVIGVELSPANVASASAAANDAGCSDRVRFVQGDSEALPLDTGMLDGALCECALCTFPDKPQSVRELARVLRPGARLALSDMTADLERLPPELTDLKAWIACIADAKPLPELVALLERAGFAVEKAEPRAGVLDELLLRVEARLKLAEMLRTPIAPEAVADGLNVVNAARRAVSDGILGYAVVIARR